MKHKAPLKIAPLPPKPGTAAPVVKPAVEIAPAATMPIKYASAAAASLPPSQVESNRPPVVTATQPISYEKLTHTDSAPIGANKEETVVIIFIH